MVSLTPYSISYLKYRDWKSLESSLSFQNFASEYTNILEICKQGVLIPLISEIQNLELMKRMKHDVADINGITINHYIQAGPSGCEHFHLLLNTLINNDRCY